jgi:GH15 family glucan-1,4-alpha-glucosidase
VRTGGYAPIGDYAALGDGRTIALVARDGSVDWLPLPRMDGPTVLGALLDARRGGRFALAPAGAFDVERRYLPRTNVLETTFRTGGGTVRVTDALTTQEGGLLPWIELARRIEGVEGSVSMEWRVEPRFGYGAQRTRIERGNGRPLARGERSWLTVTSRGAGAPEVEDGSIGARFELRAGERALVACLCGEDEPIPLPGADEIDARIEQTAASSERWIAGHAYEGQWRQAVERSALVLKLLTYAPSGAMMAAATTSLPERLGGDRNYDYRYAWVRDSAFALDALGRLGLRAQVHGSLSWLLAATAPTQPHLVPFYSLDGEVPRQMTELDLDGYRGSRPVRVGNQAIAQLQLGCYGDLLETIDLYVRHGNALDSGSATRIAESATLLCEVWANDDSAIWELEERRPYTVSKMGSWVALDRAIHLAGQGQLPASDVERWRAEAARIREFVEERCFSADRGSYVMAAGADDLDASTLLASRYGFADPRGRRMAGTIDAIRAELGAGGPLVYRYSGQETEEGAFLACSFWLVEALARAGRSDEAAEAMEQLLALANDVGLYAEEIDPVSREPLGNVPQGLTHLALINAAALLARVERGEEDRDG